MTPHRSHGRGTLVLKVRYRGVPRIERSTGTNDPKVAEQIRRMCDVLYDQGRLDLLEAMALSRGDARRLHPMQVFDRYKAGTLDKLPRAEVLVPLAEQWAAWSAAAKVAGSTTESRGKTWRGLRRHLHAAATLHDLPGALRDYRAACAAHPRTFNLARAAAMAFVRDTLGKRHALYAQVADVPVLARVSPRRKGRPFTVAGLREHMKAMPAGMGMASWTMAVTGMGPKEYFSDGFTEQADRVLIHGQKREGRERVIPRAARIEAPAVSREIWRRAFKKATPDRQPYDLRRTFPALMLAAGIPVNRRRAYMGHGARTMNELYEDAEVTQWLHEDAEALARVLGEPNPTLRLVGAA